MEYSTVFRGFILGWKLLIQLFVCADSTVSSVWTSLPVKIEGLFSGCPVIVLYVQFTDSE